MEGVRGINYFVAKSGVDIDQLLTYSKELIGKNSLEEIQMVTSPVFPSVQNANQPEIPQDKICAPGGN
jgi:hypothetical protein